MYKTCLQNCTYCNHMAFVVFAYVNTIEYFDPHSHLNKSGVLKSVKLFDIIFFLKMANVRGLIGIVKRKHHTCSIKEKLEALKRSAKGETIRKVAGDFGVGKSTLGDWKKNQEQPIRFSHVTDSLDKRCTMKSSTYADVDEAVYL